MTSDTAPNPDTLEHLEFMVSLLAGLQVLILSMVFYMLSGKIGIEEPAAVEIFTLLFAAGVLVALSRPIATAIYELVFLVRLFYHWWDRAKN